VIPICERDIEIEVPEIDKKTFVDVEIEQLQSEITQVNASAYVKVMELKEKINNLQALEHLESADNDNS
jgi:DNA polymerase III delta prime subunit